MPYPKNFLRELNKTSAEGVKSQLLEDIDAGERLVLELELSHGVNNNDRSISQEINTLCDFLKGDELRKKLKEDSEIQVILKGAFSNSDAKNLFESMRGLSINALRFSGCKGMGVDSINALGKIITPKMFALDLPHCEFGVEGSESLGDVLALNQTIRSLDLSYTDFCDSGARGLAEFVQNNSEEFLYLQMHHSNIGDGVSYLWPVVAKRDNVSGIDVTASNITSEGIKGLSALANNKGLNSLRLLYNEGIEDGGCLEIAKVIAGDNRITEFGLNNIGMSDVGLKYISESLLGNTVTTALDLSSNQKITPEGLAAANEDFRKNAFLTSVETHYNISSSESSRKELDDILARNNAIEDAVSDYSKSVLAPRLVRASCRKEGYDEIKLSDNVLKQLNNITRKQLFEGLTSEQVIEFSKHWHEPLQQVKSNQSKDFGKKEWSPLFGENAKEIDVSQLSDNMVGWKLITRTKPDELKEEGKNLDHCVGGYSGKCLTGNSHIVSVVNPNGESVSTIEIETNYQSHSYKINQHFGKRNGIISQEAQDIEEWLKAEIKDKRINIDYDFLSESKKEREQEERDKKGGRAKMVIGFDPNDSAKIRRVRGTFRDMLPEDKQIRDNFSKLASLQTVYVSVEGYKYEKYDLDVRNKSTKEPLTQEQKDDVLVQEKTAILGRIKANMDAILGEGVVSPEIVLPAEDQRNKKNRYGNVKFQCGDHMPDIDIFHKIFSEQKVELGEDNIVIKDLAPMAVIGKLEQSIKSSVQESMKDVLEDCSGKGDKQGRVSDIKVDRLIEVDRSII